MVTRTDIAPNISIVPSAAAPCIRSHGLAPEVSPSTSRSIVSNEEISNPVNSTSNPILAEDLASLEEIGFDVELTGFDISSFETIDRDVDGET
ncbi:MAG TPA: hypothetical protein GX530_07120, partial [Corynebacteriales bacterium]|nr:hypothetical protein [Mycobacteriales bacterium]